MVNEKDIDYSSIKKSSRRNLKPHAHVVWGFCIYRSTSDGKLHYLAPIAVGNFYSQGMLEQATSPI